MSFIKDLFSPPKIEMPATPVYPSKEEAKKKLKQGAISQTILTSPLGVSGEARTRRKTLLGE